jgi:hypothetical protein
VFLGSCRLIGREREPFWSIFSGLGNDLKMVRETTNLVLALRQQDKANPLKLYVCRQSEAIVFFDWGVATSLRCISW